MNEREFDLFAVTSPGLERVAKAELDRLGIGARELPGGAAFRGTLENALAANLWLRSATRVLLRLSVFDAPGRRELVARAKRVDLSPFVAQGAPLHVFAASHQSRLYHTGLVADAVHEAFGRPKAAREAAAPTLHVRLVKDRCTVSIDTSGELLHKRGWRLATTRAPLRETLAAGLLLLCGYDGSKPLVDPMCGSGTIPIEAALIASGRAPNASRAMAVDSFPSADVDRFAKLRDEAKNAGRPVRELIVGADIHGGALAAARTNAERAGVASMVRFVRASVAKLEPPSATGLLLTNPPYGHRLHRDTGDADALAELERALDGKFAAWERAVLGPGVELRRSIRLPIVRAVRLDNGGLPVELVEFRPPATERAS